MNKDRHEQYEEQVQFFDSSEALQKYLHQQVRKIKSDGSSEEVTLSSWKLSQSPEQWESAVMHAILCGVSTRKIPALRESELKGQSKSQISRLWQEKSAELVDRVQQASQRSGCGYSSVSFW